MINVTVNGKNISAKMAEDRDGDVTISISVDSVWAGTGYLREGRIEDCAAVLPEGAYEALEAEIAKGDDAAAKTAAKTPREMISAAMTLLGQAGAEVEDLTIDERLNEEEQFCIKQVMQANRHAVTALFNCARSLKSRGR